MIDAHNHLQDPRFENQQAEIIETCQALGIEGAVVNGTCETDWPAVIDLTESHADFVTPSFGLHPWKVKDRSPDWADRLQEALLEFPEAAIGECGLDRWIADPDLPAQIDVFRTHLELAVELDRPVTIHVLKAWGPLLEELRKAPSLPPFLIHSFGGSLETARELLDLGAYFSFSGYFLSPRKASVREVFQQLPADRLMIETDAPDMALPDQNEQPFNHPANLTTVSRKLSKITRIPESQFAENTRRFFKL